MYERWVEDFGIEMEILTAALKLRPDSAVLQQSQYFSQNSDLEKLRLVSSVAIPEHLQTQSRRATHDIHKLHEPIRKCRLG
jgi:hypothetical protein